MSDLLDRLFLDIRSPGNTAKCFRTQCEGKKDEQNALDQRFVTQKAQRKSVEPLRLANLRRSFYPDPALIAGTPCTRRSLRPCNSQNIPAPWSCTGLPRAGAMEDSLSAVLLFNTSSDLSSAFPSTDPACPDQACRGSGRWHVALATCRPAVLRAHPQAWRKRLSCRN